MLHMIIFFGLSVRADCCDIEILNISAENVKEQVIEETFSTCNIGKIEFI